MAQLRPVDVGHALAQEDRSDLLDLHLAAARLLAPDRAPVNPWDFPRNVLGLSGYLRSWGVKYTHGEEMTRPKYRKAVPELAPGAVNDPIAGWSLLAARWAWPRYAALALIFDRLRQASTHPIAIRHAWRPHRYNLEAAKSKAVQSDHVTACAIDLDLQCPDQFLYGTRRRILREFGKLWQSELLALSFGWNADGGRRFHVGCFAPLTLGRGHQRWWDYSGANRAPPFVAGSAALV
jgi:hypothetical protein